MLNDFDNNVITKLPDITKIEFQRIDKNYFKVIFINFFLVFTLLLVGLIVMHLWVFNEAVKPYVFHIYAAFFLILIGVFFFLLLSFPKRKYALRDKDISYKRGLLVKTLTTVPFSRIQHIEVDEKPFSRFYGLASISVFTAGDSSDDLVIKGITKEKSLEIKEFIGKQINE